MGIRVNKVIGYGLTDFTENDSRFKHFDFYKDIPKSDFINFLTHKTHEECNEFYVSFLIRHLKEMKSDFICFYNFCFYELEDIAEKIDLSKVFCMVPINQSDQWIRHDDIIDYVEQPGCSSDFKILRSIYPYLGSVVDKISKKQIDYSDWKVILDLENYCLENKEEKIDFDLCCNSRFGINYKECKERFVLNLQIHFFLKNS